MQELIIFTSKQSDTPKATHIRYKSAKTSPTYKTRCPTSSGDFHRTPARGSGNLILIPAFLNLPLHLLVLLFLILSISAIDGLFNKLDDGLIGRPGASFPLTLPLTFPLAPALPPLRRWRFRCVCNHGTALEVAPGGPRQATACIVVSNPLFGDLHLGKEGVMRNMCGGIIAPRIPKLAVPSNQVLH